MLECVQKVSKCLFASRQYAVVLIELAYYHDVACAAIFYFTAVTASHVRTEQKSGLFSSKQHTA